MKYRVIEFYSPIHKSVQFRVESRISWFDLWHTEWHFDTQEEAIRFVEEKIQKERIVYVSK